MSDKERVQLLYLLKSRQMKTVQDATPLLGRNRITLQKQLPSRWVVLEKKAYSRRPCVILDWAEVTLQKRLLEPQGFDGYQAICDWLENQLGICCESYKT